jgi:hypothetical protein
MTNEEQLSQFTLHIEAPEADAEELEGLTRQLRDEIEEVNKLPVIAEGPHYRFFINDQPVGEMTDDQWDTGNITLFTQFCQAGDSAVIEFDHMELRAP